MKVFATALTRCRSSFRKQKSRQDRPRWNDISFLERCNPMLGSESDLTAFICLAFHCAASEL